MDTVNSLVELVGNTPLVRLEKFSADVPPTILAKVEYLNPGGSVKDRIGLAMVEAAERDGHLRPGGTIVEPTSGNTGVGLAMVAAQRGYRCIFVMPDKVSDEKVDVLRAYGAEVVVCPTAVEPDDPRSYYRTADRLVRETPGAFQPYQYGNQANPAVHEATTGPEIWKQTDGRVDVFVAGIGTGGTVTGVGHILKQRKPEVQIVGADPEGSIFSGGPVHTYKVEGVGEDFWPDTFDADVIDRYVRVSDRESFLAARELARTEGLLVGGSCGTAAHAARVVAADLPADAVVVVLLPDGGRGYLSKLYNDDWMAANGFLDRRGGATRLEAVVAAKSQRLPDVVHIHPDESVRQAIAILNEFDVSQMPVVRRDALEAQDDVVGSITERALLDRVYREPQVLDEPVSRVMSEPLPMVDGRDTVEAAMGRFSAGWAAVLVCDGPVPSGVLTRSDVLDYLVRPS